MATFRASLSVSGMSIEVFLRHNVFNLTLKQPVVRGDLHRMSGSVFITRVRVFTGSSSTIIVDVFCSRPRGSLGHDRVTHSRHDKPTPYFWSMRAKRGNR